MASTRVVPTQVQGEEPQDTYITYGWKKCKQQPFVPLGILVTCGALIGATGSLRSGNRTQFNKYLRLRVAAQGVTVIAAVAGTLLLTDKSSKQKDTVSRVRNGLPPADPDSISSPSSSSSSSRLSSVARVPPTPVTTDLPAPSIQTTTPEKAERTASQKGKISTRALRQSAGLQQAEREEGGERVPMKATDFTRRLGEAERVQREIDGAK